MKLSGNNLKHALKTVAIYIHGDNSNQRKSTILRQFANIAGWVLSFMLAQKRRPRISEFWTKFTFLSEQQLKFQYNAILMFYADIKWISWVNDECSLVCLNKLHIFSINTHTLTTSRMWLDFICDSCFNLGRILLVPSVFSRQQLNSETSRLRRRSFPFPKEWAYRFSKVS